MSCLLKLGGRIMKGKIVIVSIAIFVMLAGVSLFGQTNINFMGVGGMLGYISPESDIGSTIAFGGRADLGTIFKPNIKLMAEGLFWSKGDEVSDMYGGTIKTNWRQIYVSALTKYCFGKSGEKVTPYVGGGLGMVFYRFKSEYKSSSIITKANLGSNSAGLYGSTYSHSDSDLALHLLGGVDYILSPQLTGFAEFRYVTDGADFWGIFVGAIYHLK